MKGTGITKVLFLVALAGCVVYASILDKVDSLKVLKGDDSSRVVVKTGVLRRGEEGDKDKKVVLKIFQSSVIHTKEEAIRDGKNEHKALKKINSPYVIKAIEGEVDDGGYTLVEEYFDGCTIDDLPRKYYDVRDVYEILSQFGEGIDAIHRSEIVHTNLYTGNLMIGSNVHGIRVKIIDFDDCESLGGVYAGSIDWEWFGRSMYELFAGKKIQFIDTPLGIRCPELPNLDPRLSSLVKALCISRSIKTYDDYLDVLKSHNWETGEKLLIGMKACLTDANRV